MAPTGRPLSSVTAVPVVEPCVAPGVGAANVVVAQVSEESVVTPSGPSNAIWSKRNGLSRVAERTVISRTCEASLRDGETKNGTAVALDTSPRKTNALLFEPSRTKEDSGPEFLCAPGNATVAPTMTI